MRDRLPLALRLYRLAFNAAAPALAPRLLRWRLSRGKEHPARLAERYGEATQPRPTGPLIWLHGASVGEMLAVIPLIERIRAQNFAVLVTSGTVTSAALAEQRLPAGAVHQFIPLDAPRFVGRFLDHWRPDLALFVESDLVAQSHHGVCGPRNSDDPGQRPRIGALVPPLAVLAGRDRGAARALRSVPGAIERRRRTLCAAWRAAHQQRRQSQARRARPAGRPADLEQTAGRSSARARSSPPLRLMPAKRPPSSPRIGGCAQNFRRC